MSTANHFRGGALKRGTVTPDYLSEIEEKKHRQRRPWSRGTRSTERLKETVIASTDECTDVAADGRVTVLIPTRDRIGLLERTIDSVLMQTRPPDRIVVVDNSQSDPEATRDLCDRRGDHYLTPLRNLTKNENHQRALAFGRTEFLCILQDDDLYRPRFIEVCLQHLTSDPEAALVAVNYSAIDADDRVTSERAWGNFRAGRHEPESFYAYVMQEMSPVHLSASMFRRRAAVSTGFAEVDSMVSDMGLFLRIVQSGAVHLVDAPLSAIRIHSSQTSTMNGWFNDIAFTLVPLEFGVKDRFLRSPGAITLLGDRTLAFRRNAARRARRIYFDALRQRHLPLPARWKLAKNLAELSVALHRRT